MDIRYTSDNILPMKTCFRDSVRPLSSLDTHRIHTSIQSQYVVDNVVCNARGQNSVDSARIWVLQSRPTSALQTAKLQQDGLSHLWEIRLSSRVFLHESTTSKVAICTHQVREGHEIVPLGDSGSQFWGVKPVPKLHGGLHICTGCTRAQAVFCWLQAISYHKICMYGCVDTDHICKCICVHLYMRVCIDAHMHPHTHRWTLRWAKPGPQTRP